MKIISSVKHKKKEIFTEMLIGQDFILGVVQNQLYC